MDELESAYQKQLEDLETQLDGVKAENLTLCMEVQDIGKEVQKEVQMVCSSDGLSHTMLTSQCGLGISRIEYEPVLCDICHSCHALGKVTTLPPSTVIDAWIDMTFAEDTAPR